MALTLHTSLGDLKLELYCDQVPRTSYNFLALCASGYYNETKFHRNIKGFMVQGGDPTGTGKGGNCVYDTPKFADEIVPSIKHDKAGIVSMANSGPNTNGSQFFITYAAHTHLDGKYTIFGHVISGQDDTLKKMEDVHVDGSDRPVSDIILKKVTIHANPIAEMES